MLLLWTCSFFMRLGNAISQILKYILAVLGRTCFFLLPVFCFVVESRIRVYQWFLNDLDLFFWWLFTDCIKGFVAMKIPTIWENIFGSFFQASEKQVQDTYETSPSLGNGFPVFFCQTKFSQTNPDTPYMTYFWIVERGSMWVNTPYSLSVPVPGRSK